MARVVPTQVVELIDKLFPMVKEQIESSKDFALYWGQSGAIASILYLMEKVPDELLVMRSERYIEFVSSIAVLRDLLEKWPTQGEYSLNRIVGLRPLNPITLLREALADCPDEFPAAGTAELGFVRDTDLRESLRRDIGAVNIAVVNVNGKQRLSLEVP